MSQFVKDIRSQRIKWQLPFTIVLLANYNLGFAEKNKIKCNIEDSGYYALAIANKQFSFSSSFANKPFSIKYIHEVTTYSLSESGMNTKEIAISQETDPVEVHQVFLQSKDDWECNYYVTFSTSHDRYCDFKAIRFHFCSK